MIPKIIHYCWFGKGQIPQSQKKCIEGWKKLMPDYEIKRWDESTFDLEKYPLAKYACEVKKYALASDVCRYNVLTEYGGIYLDTDVDVFERFDKLLDCNFFSGLELYHEFEQEMIVEKYSYADFLTHISFSHWETRPYRLGKLITNPISWFKYKKRQREIKKQKLL